MTSEKLEMLMDNWKIDLVALLIVAAISQGVNMVKYYTDLPYVTSLVYGIEGSAVALFQTFTFPSLTMFAYFMYIGFYPAFLLGSAIFLKLHSKRKKNIYIYSYVLTMLISVPVFYLLPVEVTGYYINSLDPLLYSNQMFGSPFRSMGDLHSAIPSLHTGLMAVAAVNLHNHSTRAGVVGWVSTIAIMLTTFYLGIHWMTDAFVGATFAVASFFIIKKISERNNRWFNW